MGDKNYLDNEEFLMTIINFTKASSPEKEYLRNQIMMDFWLLIENIAKRPNFSNYTDLEDMKSNAFINCVNVLDRGNFDISKNNPFSYFSQIIFYSFINDIKKFKKKTEFEFNLMSDFMKDNENGDDNE